VSKFSTGFIVLLILLSACHSEGGKNIPTYTVSRANFENTLFVDGFTEPVRTANATCPPYIEGIVTYLVEDGVHVKEGDTVCIVEVQELQTNYDQMLIDLENAQAGLNRIKADLSSQYALLEAQVRSNEAETSIARLDSLQIKYSTPNQTKIKELELSRVTIEKERYEKKLQALAFIQQSEIRRRELEIQQFVNRIESVKSQLDALTVKAPKSGLAIRAVYRMTGKKLQVGDMIWHLMPLVIIPDLSEMKVKIKAPEVDYKYINIDDSVVYTFDAMPDNSAWGKVTIKSPVGQPYKEGAKVKFFDIEASIDSTLTMPNPGFTVNCRIFLKEVKDTLVVPQVAIFEVDSMKVVYVKSKKGYEMRQVSTGLTSPKEAIITAGLQDKEVIALSKPNSSLVKKKVLLPGGKEIKDVKDVKDVKKENEENKSNEIIEINGDIEISQSPL
jgi:multidrug efflux pump subunit AcrA (membrane-fusion protein)